MMTCDEGLDRLNCGVLFSKDMSRRGDEGDPGDMSLVTD